MIISIPEISIVIADDHEIFRDGFKLTLNSVENFTVIGEASNGTELIEVVNKTKPDVIITDIKMPFMDGVEATKVLMNESSNRKVIGLSMFDDDETILDMLEAGALGYLVKNAEKAELIDAVNSVYKGEAYNCRFTNSKLTKILALRKKRKTAPVKTEPLTERELDVIALLCEGYTNKEISEKYCLSLRTIEGVRLKAQEKIGAKNIAGVVVFAMQYGLYQPKKSR
ncbi:response regulator transcription factor [Polluticaenibacter yanchengensis]|uniref:Response regulator transcription factor n=1 Tax=Polluticaenibacter yanchengensis TaxID=3014562 RepID=A0ABT4UP31_9BACT|nr:response regulator transcription factor [Chitinophagaceae bacterium LY-5]